MFQASFQTPNIKYSYSEVASGLKQSDKETIEELDVHFTNVLWECCYPQDQLDSCKDKVLLCTVKYFDSKQLVYESNLTLNYHTFKTVARCMNEPCCHTGKHNEMSHPQEKCPQPP